jgi:hypothetical protein
MDGLLDEEKPRDDKDLVNCFFDGTLFLEKEVAEAVATLFFFAGEGYDDDLFLFVGAISWKKPSKIKAGS